MTSLFILRVRNLSNNKDFLDADELIPIIPAPVGLRQHDAASLRPASGIETSSQGETDKQINRHNEKCK